MKLLRLIGKLTNRFVLVKKLKEAGFPQKEKGDFVNPPDCELNYPVSGIGIYIPTLSELIEACGDEFGSLTREDDGSFYAVNVSNKAKYGFGSTPEEAVANLWLELNKNGDDKATESL